MSRAAPDPDPAPDLNPTAGSLLGFLHGGPRTGWDLDQAVASSMGNFWNVTRSQIYRELRALAENGFVEAGPSGPRDRVPYQITESGREAFGRWIAQPPGPDMIRSRLLLTVFFGEYVDPGRLATMLEEQLARHARLLEEYVEMSVAFEGERGLSVRTLDFGIAYEKAMCSWLRGILAELDAPGR